MTLTFNIRQETKIFKNIITAPTEIDIETLLIDIKGEELIAMQRPIAVRGVVNLTDTKGRKAAPNPVAFDSLGAYIKSVTHQKRFRFLAPYSDRGHIFAMELGGPDSKYNIIPQWSGFQEHGDWRKVEREIKNKAKILLLRGNTLFLEINVEYANLEMQDLREKMLSLFTFNKEEDYLEAKIKECLQVFGTPVSYSFNSFPCNLQLKRPRNFSLSISYIKYLYEVAYRVASNKEQILLETKTAITQKQLSHLGWKTRKLLPSDLVNTDAELYKNIHSYCYSGLFVF